MLQQRLTSLLKAGAIAGLIVLGAAAAAAPAQAGDYHGHNYNRYGYNYGNRYSGGYVSGYRGYYGRPTPPVHYHLQYHPTHSHWTPYRGWHTHGHYDLVPHYGW